LAFPASRLPGGGWALTRRIRSAAVDAATFHWVIDVPAIAAEAGRTERIIARVARRIAELRDRGLVQVETLTMAAARLAAVPAASPQRSILLRAA
jgi:hypothetical protein